MFGFAQSCGGYYRAIDVLLNVLYDIEAQCCVTSRSGRLPGFVRMVDVCTRVVWHMQSGVAARPVLAPRLCSAFCLCLRRVWS